MTLLDFAVRFGVPCASVLATEGDGALAAENESSQSDVSSGLVPITEGIFFFF